MIGFLDLAGFIVVAVAARLVYVHLRPFRIHRWCKGLGCRWCGGRGEVRRLGAGWTARLHLIVLQMIDERRTR